MAMTRRAATSVVLAVVVFSPHVAGKVGGPFAAINGDRVGLDDLQAAMDAVMGCGSSDEVEREWDTMQSAKEALMPMWKTLPKNSNGRVSWRSLRYMAHRHFMQRYGLMVRGFEPSRIVNASHIGHADVFESHVPHFVELLMDEGRAARGFMLEDAASLVLTLERLMFDSESATLKRAYDHEHVATQGRLNSKDLFQVLETYMVHWMIGADEETIEYALENPSALEVGFPHWQDIRSFVTGQIHALDYTRANGRQPNKESSSMLRTYTFDDAHEMVGSITKSFGSFWEGVCQEMKGTLVSMDTRGTGRVPLSQFYGSALTTEARFGESEAYLRDLGALDETSVWREKQVLIANYMQGVSNCIVSGSNYLVCCANECEGILGEIEVAIGAPTALPHHILRVVRNISTPSSEDDSPPLVDGPLAAQLERLADLHGGRVPLHSRLFAQWLHYVYPRECAFPHKAGLKTTQTPTEYGNHLATDAEMRRHAETVADGSTEKTTEAADEARWMSQQWSEEQEVLFAGHTAELRAPWEVRYSCATVGGAMAAFLLATWYATASRGKQGGSLLPLSGSDTTGKSHLV